MTAGVVCSQSFQWSPPQIVVYPGLWQGVQQWEILVPVSFPLCRGAVSTNAQIQGSSGKSGLEMQNYVFLSWLPREIGRHSQLKSSLHSSQKCMICHLFPLQSEVSMMQVLHMKQKHLYQTSLFQTAIRLLSFFSRASSCYGLISQAPSPSGDIFHIHTDPLFQPDKKRTTNSNQIYYLNNQLRKDTPQGRQKTLQTNSQSVVT